MKTLLADEDVVGGETPAQPGQSGYRGRPPQHADDKPGDPRAPIPHRRGGKRNNPENQSADRQEEVDAPAQQHRSGYQRRPSQHLNDKPVKAAVRARTALLTSKNQLDHGAVRRSRLIRAQTPKAPRAILSPLEIA
jgi:hypothetical protein